MVELDLKSFIETLFDGCWFHYFFPFLLVFAIVYTVLKQTDLFKKNSVKFLIALIFALFAIAFPITENTSTSKLTHSCSIANGGLTLGDLMIQLFPGVSAFGIGILALYIISAMLGVSLPDFVKVGDHKVVQYVLGALGLIFVIYYFAKGFGWLDDANFRFLENSWPIIFIIVIFLFFTIWIVGDDDNNDKDDKNQRGITINHGGEK